MFTTVKVRRGLARDDYKDPGWYKQPPGTQAYEWNGALPQTQRAAETGPAIAGPSETMFNVKKGNSHGKH
jgi:hypothetical protein